MSNQRLCCCGCNCNCATQPDPINMTAAGITGCCRTNLISGQDESGRNFNNTHAAARIAVDDWKINVGFTIITDTWLSTDLSCTNLDVTFQTDQQEFRIICDTTNDIWEVIGAHTLGGVSGYIHFYQTFSGNICGNTLVLSNQLTLSDCRNNQVTSIGTFEINGYGGTMTLSSACG